MTLFELVGYVALYNFVTLSNGPVMVAMLEQTLVTDRHALSLEQLLFAFTVGRVTPGPASSYVPAIGYLMHGVAGAALTTAAIVAPGYLILPMMRGYERIKKLRRVQGFVDGLVAAQVGLIFTAIFRLGRETMTGASAWLIALVTFVLVHVLKKSAPLALGVAAVVGLALHFLG
jgi:chromate transporter